jgi:hypothetical protein
MRKISARARGESLVEMLKGLIATAKKKGMKLGLTGVGCPGNHRG